MLTPRVRIAIALGLACTLAACQTDQGPVDRTGTELVSGASPLELRRLSLSQQLEREKARVAAAQERGEEAYDSLRTIWDAYSDRFGNGGSPLLMCDPLQYAATV